MKPMRSPWYTVRAGLRSPRPALLLVGLAIVASGCWDSGWASDCAGFHPHCEGGRAIQGCNGTFFGASYQSKSCAALGGQTCVEGNGLADCVLPGYETCDPAQPLPGAGRFCVPGDPLGLAVRVCSKTGFVALDVGWCDARSEACFEKGQDAACIYSPLIPCDPADHWPRMVCSADGMTLIWGTCTPLGGVAVAGPVESCRPPETGPLSGMPTGCVARDGTAACVSLPEQRCTAEGPARCSADGQFLLRRRCTAVGSFVTTAEHCWENGKELVCAEQEGSTLCVEPPVRRCDPAVSEAAACSPDGRSLVFTRCAPPGLVTRTSTDFCSADTHCEGGGGFAACVAATAATCDPSGPPLRFACTPDGRQVEVRRCLPTGHLVDRGVYAACDKAGQVCVGEGTSAHCAAPPAAAGGGRVPGPAPPRR